LEKKGRIQREFHVPRSVRLTGQAPQRQGVPILGRVAAGTPILATQNIEGHLAPSGLLPFDDTCFCLSVVGDSMVGEGIRSGDYVVVRQKPDFENGEIGVAILDGEATVKKLRKRGGLIDLIPANEGYETTTVDPNKTDFRYAGEVIGVHRILKRLRREDMPA
jgi:repressor LexA